MALSQTDLDTLDTAIATGELTVEFDGRRVTYRSIPELKAARQHVATQLAVASGQRRPGAYTVQFATSRDY